MVPRIIIINGPNLNLLGRREPAIYGEQTFKDYLLKLREKFPRVQIEYLQSNHEGQIIDWLQGFGFHVSGMIINAGGYSHTSVAIRDAIQAIPCPVIDVHISNIYEREEFRHTDLLKDVCLKAIVGKGLPGYEEAVRVLLREIVLKG